MPSLRSLVFVSIALVAGVHADCYWPNGDLAANMHQCHGGGVLGSCCQDGWSCLANKACGNFADPRQDYALNNIYQRQACTDKSWQSNQCPQYCTSTSSGQGAAVMYQCNATHVCCDNGNNGSLCCLEEAQKFFIGTPANLSQPFANFTLPDPNVSPSSSIASQASAATIISTVTPTSSGSAAALANVTTEETDNNRTLKLAVAIAVPIAILLAIITGIITFFVIRRKNRRLDELENHVRVLNHAVVSDRVNEKSGWHTSVSDVKSPWYDSSPPGSKDPPRSATDGRAELLDGKHEDAKELSGRHIGMSLSNFMKARFSSASPGLPVNHEKGRGVLDAHQTINKDRDGYYRPHPALRSDQKTPAGNGAAAGNESHYSIVPPYRSASSYRQERTPTTSASNGPRSPGSSNNLKIYNAFDVERPASRQTGRTGADGVAIARPLDHTISTVEGTSSSSDSSPHRKGTAGTYMPRGGGKKAGDRGSDSDTSPVDRYEQMGTSVSITSPFGGPQSRSTAQKHQAPSKSAGTGAPKLPLSFLNRSPVGTTSGGGSDAVRRTNTDGVSPTDDPVSATSGKRTSPVSASRPLPTNPIYRNGF